MSTHICHGSTFNNAVTFGTGATVVEMDNCVVKSGSSAGITMSAGLNCSISNTTIESSNNPSIDGSGGGTLDLTGIVFLDDDNIAGALTISSGTSYSGTLKTDYTDHGVILGQGSETNMVATSAGTDGQVFLGATGADPAFATLTSTGSTIDFTLGANSLNLDTASEVSNSFPTDSGTATPSSGALTVAGGTNINTSGASSTVTVNLDGDVLGLTDLTVDNLELNGNTISSTDTNGNVVIAPDGTGVVSVTTAPIVPSGDRADSLGSATNSWDNVYCDGVTFDDGTNVMSNYTVSTWTPVLEFGGDSTGITYSTQSGIYTQIGNMVFVQCAITLTNKGSASGSAVITGLPVTVGGANIPIPLNQYSNLTYLASRDAVFAQADATTTNLSLFMSGDNTGQSALTDTQFANNTIIVLSGWYAS